MKCRHCHSDLTLSLVDLGSAPPSNAYLTRKSIQSAEKWFPLRVLVCTHCWLVQTEDYARHEVFFDDNYLYYSSFSDTWLAHAKCYVHYMIERFQLSTSSHVVEVAANDGYLLQYVQANGIPCTGIEPTASTGKAARDKGIPIVEDFFGVRLAEEITASGKQADLITANNVLAHVPDINDFVSGFTVLLKPNGTATFEFPHLAQLISGNQFDTIYHEHFTYLSLTSVSHIFEANGLSVFDVEEYPTHGGSLRVFAQRSDYGKHETTSRVAKLMAAEYRAGITSPRYYADFQQNADRAKDNLLGFLLKAKHAGKRVAAYGAAAKGNTLLNYAGVRPDLLQYVVDKNPAKQGKYLPGSRIPILNIKFLENDKPDYVVILPWNLKSEIMHQLDYIKKWNGQFVTAIPNLKIV